VRFFQEIISRTYSLEWIGNYAKRHPGRDSRWAILPNGLRVNANLFPTDLCRDQKAMDGNVKTGHKSENTFLKHTLFKNPA
jgi:hypothetical protein